MNMNPYTAFENLPEVNISNMRENMCYWTGSTEV